MAFADVKYRCLWMLDRLVSTHPSFRVGSLPYSQTLYKALRAFKRQTRMAYSPGALATKKLYNVDTGTTNVCGTGEGADVTAGGGVGT